MSKHGITIELDEPIASGAMELFKELGAATITTGHRRMRGTICEILTEINPYGYKKCLVLSDIHLEDWKMNVIGAYEEVILRVPLSPTIAKLEPEVGDVFSFKGRIKFPNTKGGGYEVSRPNYCSNITKGKGYEV